MFILFVSHGIERGLLKLYSFTAGFHNLLENWRQHIHQQSGAKLSLDKNLDHCQKWSAETNGVDFKQLKNVVSYSA
jgi:hypothetical protein